MRSTPARGTSTTATTRSAGHTVIIFTRRTETSSCATCASGCQPCQRRRDLKQYECNRNRDRGVGGRAVGAQALPQTARQEALENRVLLEDSAAWDALQVLEDVDEARHLRNRAAGTPSCPRYCRPTILEGYAVPLGQHQNEGDIPGFLKILARN